MPVTIDLTEGDEQEGSSNGGGGTAASSSSNTRNNNNNPSLAARSLIELDDDNDNDDISFVGGNPGLSLPRHGYNRGHDGRASTHNDGYNLQDRLREPVQPAGPGPFSRHANPVAGPSTSRSLRIYEEDRPLAVRSGTRTPPVPGSSRLTPLQGIPRRTRNYVAPPPARAARYRAPRFSNNDNDDDDEIQITGENRIIAPRPQNYVAPPRRPNQGAGGRFAGMFDGVGAAIVDQFLANIPGMGLVRVDNEADLFDMMFRNQQTHMNHQQYTRSQLKSKKYSIKSSHNGIKKGTPGFSRDVFPPPEIDEAEKENTDNSKMKEIDVEDHDDDDDEKPVRVALSREADVPALALDPSTTNPTPRTRKILTPVCASCLTPFFLNQSSRKRPYLLKCMHVVCLPCLADARRRLQEHQEDAQIKGLLLDDFEEYTGGMPGGWQDEKKKGKKRKVTTKDDDIPVKKVRTEEEEEPQLSRTGRPIRRTAATRSLAESPGPTAALPKNNKKAVTESADSKKAVAEVQHDWMSCPVAGCKAGTDLTAKLGSREGAWEMFV